MSAKKYLLIINPTAHNGDAAKQSNKIISILKNKNIDFDLKYTQRKFHAIDIAKYYRKDYETIVAVGGDGTIAEVITGLLIDNETGAKAKLGVIHVGTSPDFNKYHRIPTKIDEAIKTILKGKTKLIDIGKITYFSEPNSKEKTVSYFASNVNIGLGPLIAGKANSRFRKYLGDFLGTLTAFLVSLASLKKFNLEIDIDGQANQFSRLINLTVGKDPFLASGMRVFSKIRPDDGKLYIFSAAITSSLRFLANIPKLYCGDFLRYDGAKINYGQKVKINYCQNYPQVEFDGDVKGYLPAMVEVIPKALEVIA
ncbi:MAG: diacylglycerol kinase family protein [Candidatus Omnitrophica bacterium]|nr:diacylglycerol kinase family protein [Candidatus Omnitrophota bacterium]HOX53832.1 diacylglycerol kinase family protein [Candidatus Omnitrophota bacterium]